MAARLCGPVIYAEIRGEDQCAALAAHLVRASREFHVDPMPGNVWRFSLKDEPGNADLLPVFPEKLGRYVLPYPGAR